MALQSPSVSRGRPLLLRNVGTPVSLSGVSIEEIGDGPIRTTRFIFTAYVQSIYDTTGPDGAGAVAAASGVKLYTFPKGLIEPLGGASSLVITTTSAIASTLNSGVTVSVGFGTAQVSSATLATTMQNFIPGSGASVANFTSSTTINVAPTAWKGVSAQTVKGFVDGTTTAAALYLNIGVPTATDIDADATVSITGEALINWMNHGNLGVVST